MLKTKQIFSKCFYDNTIKKFFHGSLNMVVILAPDCNFFTVKCAQFSLAFME